jgi:hypothetical protein
VALTRTIPGGQYMSMQFFYINLIIELYGHHH